MKATSLILMALSLLTAVNAHGRRKQSTQQPQPQPEAWPEEVPDYAPVPSVDPTALPTVELPMPSPFTEMADDELVEYLMCQPIMGEPMIEPEVLQRFVARHNPDFDPAIAEAYISVGRRYGIRGDIALCQSILETGWFKFSDGTMVSPDQHNYCGLGVTKRGERGSSFATIEEGVTAQIQHLYAYACAEPIPEGETLLDPRFKLVTRGVAPTWNDLSGRWAANDRYARSILKLYVQLHRFNQP